MDVGIGLPATIRGVQGGQLLEWARRAEARGFSTLGTIDRLVYGNYEPLIALAAAAAVTERSRLATTIMIASYRANGALVAKQAASVHRLSGQRAEGQPGPASRVFPLGHVALERPPHLPGLAFSPDELWQLRRAFDISAR